MDLDRETDSRLQHNIANTSQPIRFSARVRAAKEKEHQKLVQQNTSEPTSTKGKARANQDKRCGGAVDFAWLGADASFVIPGDQYQHLSLLANLFATPKERNGPLQLTRTPKNRQPNARRLVTIEERLVGNRIERRICLPAQCEPHPLSSSDR